MMGFIFFGAIGLWVWLIIKINRFIGKKLPPKAPRKLILTGSFFLLFFLPWTDELIANRQLAALCTKEPLLEVNVEKIKGRELVLSVALSRWSMPIDGAVPLFKGLSVYTDSVTGEVLAKSIGYRAQGGFFMQMLPSNATTPPNIFAGNGCSGAIKPDGRGGSIDLIAAPYGAKIIYR